MKKANFKVAEWCNYNDVPIPDNIKDKDVISWLIEQLENGNLSKYLTDFELNAETPIYEVIIENEDETEYTITIDDWAW